jgi:hypothetical protein
MFNVAGDDDWEELTERASRDKLTDAAISNRLFCFYETRACVGIRVEPKGDEDWFCRACISRKQSDQTGDGKKKKRKKKDKDKRDH